MTVWMVSFFDAGYCNPVAVFSNQSAAEACRDFYNEKEDTDRYIIHEYKAHDTFTPMGEE